MMSMVGRLYRLIPRDGKKLAAAHEAEISRRWSSADIEQAHALDENDPDVREALDEIRAGRDSKVSGARAIHPQDQ